MDIKSTFNANSIRENIIIIQKKIATMIEEGNDDIFEHELNIMTTMPDFYQDHPFLVKKICKREDLTILYKMLENLDSVENGDKSLSSVELNLGEELANKFLYPVIDKNKKNK